ncbi:uncharacterized protein BDZ99DRAFT_526042 [Mytilinidion resinicola]|uniref:RING-type domain-containing protein n=1 Tax=Mytilinidion resinicola TaxID=574789 RepID=A0A6A6Y5R5_9PEZI|nr:uncharacterized protein BDZ99DRAFT_526042 [Mytilinidion resinicola]KAF2804000.1 hypothetical protein BDZ99DRAFT_526042 [Mytilinidion resinicola]
MSHSKRNTSLAFFTSHERAELKSTWGSQSTRLSRDSFLTFGSCQLCLLPAVDPVTCPSGDLFCRECAMNNLLAQRKEIKRLEKDLEKQRKEDEEEKAQDDDEARERAVKDFEAVQMGLEVKIGAGGKVIGREGGKVVVEKVEDLKDDETPEQGRGKKRKFEIDEEELLRIAKEERGRAKLALDEERRAAHPHLPSFWVPSETPSSNHTTSALRKHNPTCPASSTSSPHDISLKTLTAVHFTKEMSSDGGSVPSCPSCRKALTNSTKACLAIPCGHVLCKPCVAKFMTPHHRHHRDAHDEDPEPETIHCYVCDADLTTPQQKKAKHGKEHKKDKERGLKPGLVEIRSEGTGFAGGGKNVVKRQGVAFQV